MGKRIIKRVKIGEFMSSDKDTVIRKKKKIEERKKKKSKRFTM